MTSHQIAPGTHLAKLRAARGMSQVGLARKANISVSLLSKIEVGSRTLTPAAAAALGRAMGLTMDEVLGKAPVAAAEAESLRDLRAAMRDFDLPRPMAVEPDEVAADLRRVSELRDAVELTRLTGMLPPLLRKVTAHAHAAHTTEAWAALAETYSAVYWLAARHRWMDLAEVAVSRQRWAAEQRADPLVQAIADRDRAGTYLNFGDCEGGLAVIDRAIGTAEARLTGERRAIATGILHLRGMTLAGRLPDKREADRQAGKHIKYARRLCASFAEDFRVHGLTFGPRNTLTHEMATLVDLKEPKKALALTGDLATALAGLPPTRLAPSFIAQARAQLDTGDAGAALESLARAQRIAPQMVRIHPMALEVLRVVDSLHKRSNPLLNRLRTVIGPLPSP
ncbi:helix-turn-helix domain-containing protein [Streptomyces sp. PT12]|uniref:helix-turn-helix domain-containing protein n=1 Tax=Streptomyces sp. PT12 TaxID=1510197 RepID=UPI000DE27B29|nr:helix-turn-helix transcriptional regulator [Streptomyces sp. PT12]RBM16134.1 hypothetical protein DEH69_17175 [Streptomyces sp. PT12]